MEHNKTKVKLSRCALAAGFATAMGCALFCLGLINTWWDWGGQLLETLSSLYLGFDGSIKGACIGLLWGALVGSIVGTIISTVYNCCVKHCPCRSCKCDA